MVLWIPIKEMQINHLCTYNCMKESNLALASWKIPTIIVGHHMFNLPKIHNYHKIYVTFHVNEQPLHTQKSSIKIYFFKSQHNSKSRTRNSYKDSDLKLHLSNQKKKKFEFKRETWKVITGKCDSNPRNLQLNETRFSTRRFSHFKLFFTKLQQSIWFKFHNLSIESHIQAHSQKPKPNKSQSTKLNSN